MTRQDAVKLLAKMREVVEHPSTPDEERLAALARIRQLKDKWKIGQYEVYEELKPGRKKAPEKRKDRIVKFRVTAHEHAKLLRAAQTSGNSLSEYLREQVLAALPLKE